MNVRKLVCWCTDLRAVTLLVIDLGLLSTETIALFESNSRRQNFVFLLYYVSIRKNEIFRVMTKFVKNP